MQFIIVTKGVSLDLSWITSLVATLALGLQPKQGLTKVSAKSETEESYFMLLEV
jgi:hypothetical protein